MEELASIKNEFEKKNKELENQLEALNDYSAAETAIHKIIANPVAVKIINQIIDKLFKPKFKSKFTPPYRVGPRKKRTILDSKNKQVIVFPKGSEAEASAYCEYLNKIT